MQLYDKNWLDAHQDTLSDWKKDAFQQFSSMLIDTDHPYPCVPGMQGFLKNHLRFQFVGDPREEKTFHELASTLAHYGDISRDTGKYASLVVFFETSDELLNESQEAFQDMFWTILNEVHALDEKEWPENIPTDPHDTAWEYSFCGEPYFVFCATPYHQVRKSRHFPYFMLAFQPRWVFAEINDSTSFGRKMKKAIRSRLKAYDKIAPHPDLKWYGKSDNHEWKQYFLSDDDNESKGTCPFTYMKKKLNKLLP
ncbi:YqcI/YcgG family protein [Bacillus kexueae]|uniref:YqcI/YcgG family protein n=1 Tax=Aeribacillus kexueae TaxID=2078952 RepID=UPI001FAFDCD1|nr:YqcI/YcgG family protein [Bacillus kexueae]